MTVDDELLATLRDLFGWRKQRLECFALMLTAMVRARQVNLAMIAPQMSAVAEISSSYRRLQRFFSEVRFDYDALALYILRWFGADARGSDFILDRTNWKLGRRNINILMLSFSYNGFAIPVFWLLLNKQGNSDQRERIALMQRFIRLVGREYIALLLGDREFIGKRWWQWLAQRNIPFLFRMKASQLSCREGKKPVPVARLFDNLAVGKTRILRTSRVVGGVKVWLSASRLDNGDLLITASNCKLRQAIERYRVRWQIETLFQNLKGRGLQLESTRLIKRTRLKKLLAVTAIATCWMVKTGVFIQRTRWRKTTNGQGQERVGILRTGLDALVQLLTAALYAHKTALITLQLLICPYDQLSKTGRKLQARFNVP